MADYEYAIGTSVDNLQNLEDDLLIPPPHPAPFTEWAKEYEAGDGHVHGDGWPSCEWRWDYLHYTHVQALRTYCEGKSAHIYIRTLKADGITYATYYGIVVWPTMPGDVSFQMGRASTDFKLKFTHLEEVT